MSNAYETYTIPFDKSDNIVKFMRDNYPLSGDYPLTEDGDKNLFLKAQELYPQYDFPDWKGKKEPYPSNPQIIDYSPITVNDTLNQVSEVNDYFDNPENKESLNQSIKKYEQSRDTYNLKKNRLNIGEFLEGQKTKEREYNIFELIADKPFVNKEWQDKIQNSINNSRAGHLYAIRTEEEKYPGANIEDYDERWYDTIADFFIGHGDAAGITSLAMFGKFQKAGEISSQVLRWGFKSTGNYLSRLVPKDKYGQAIKKIIQKRFPSGEAVDGAVGLGFGLGSVYASAGALESAANQRMNEGKYEDNDGTINSWDTIVDASTSFKDGLLTGFGMYGVQNTLGKMALYTNPRWARGRKDWKTVGGKILSNPISQAGIHGLTFTSLPLAFSEETRQSYMDSEGNFDFSLLGKRWLGMSGISSIFLGLGRLSNPNLRAPKFSEFDKKNFGLSLNKSERDILKKKAIELRKGIDREIDIPYEKWEAEVLSGAEGTKFLRGLMTGKIKLPVSLKEKVLSYFGKRPKMPWDETGEVKGTVLPDKINYYKTIKQIQGNVKKDVKYENNKVVNKKLRAREDIMLEESVENIRKDLGVNTPFEFFEKTIDKETGLIETEQGLLSILDISNKTLNILDRIAIKDKSGNVIGYKKKVDISNDDAFYLHFVSPLIISGYQGYKSRYYDTTEGQEEYIKRLEKEELDGKKLTDNQRKASLLAFENQLKQYDIIRDYVNRRVIEGNTESEQLKTQNELSTKKKKVVAIDENKKPVDNTVMNVDKDEADAGIEQGTLIDVKNADNPIEIKSDNHGDYKYLMSEISQAVSKGIEKGLEQNRPYSGPDGERENVGILTFQAKVIIPKIRGDELSIRAKKSKGTKSEFPESSIDAIKDKLDIWALQKLSDSSLKKWVKDANNLLKWTGKDDFSSITEGDIQGWFDSMKKIRRSKGKVPGIQTGITTSIRKIFGHLTQKKVVDVNPATEDILTKETKLYNKLKDKFKEKLPALKTWFGQSDLLYKKAKNDNALKLAIEIYDKFLSPLRNLELNALKGIHIKVHTFENGEIQHYLDFSLPLSQGGAAKENGVYRPFPITKEFFDKLQKHVKDTKTLNKNIFPNVAKKLGQVTKAVFGEKYNSFAYKRQIKTFAERQVLEGNIERDIFNALSGHADSKDPSILILYRNQENWDDFFPLANEVINKIQKAKEEFMKPTIPVVVKEKPELGKIGKVVKGVIKKLGEPGQKIEIVKDETDEQILEKVSKYKRIPRMDKEVKKKYVKAIKNTFKTYTEDMSKLEKDALLKFFAKQAGIENFDKFKISVKTHEPELVLFGNEIYTPEAISRKKKADIFRVIYNTDRAKQIAESGNVSIEQRKNLIKTMFRKKEFLQLTPSESYEYLKQIKLSSDYDANDYWLAPLKDDYSFAKAVENMPKKTQMKFLSGFGGDISLTFPTLEKTFGLKGLTKLGVQLHKHLIRELDEGARLETFQNKAKLALAPKKLRIRPKGTIKLGVRQPKLRFVEGEKAFDKIKNDFFWLQKEKFLQLKEHIDLYPDDKEGIKVYNRAKKFIDKIYDEEKGTLLIDTPESNVGRAWYEMHDGYKESVILALKSVMTEPQWKTFKDKYGIKWIKDTFYVHRKMTDEFSKAADLKSKRVERLLEKDQKEIAHNLAVEKYGKNPTVKQVDSFMDEAMIDAKNSLIEGTKRSNKKVTPNYIINRRLEHFPPRVKIGNKYLWTWEHEYDKYQPSFSAGMSKLIATVEFLPFMIDMKGLPKNYKGYASILQGMHRDGGLVGSYVAHMVYGRIGLSQYNNPLTKDVATQFSKVNHMVTRGHLSWFASAIKNYGIGNALNIMKFDLKQLAQIVPLSMSFERRMDGKGYGIIQLSLSAMEKRKSKVSNFFEHMFRAGKFPSSEEATRLSSAFGGLLDIAKMVDGLRSNDPKRINFWLNIAKDFYQLSDMQLPQFKFKVNQIMLVKEVGLGDLEVDWKGKGSLTKQGLGAEMFAKVGNQIRLEGKIINLSAREVSLLQREVDLLQKQFMHTAHINLQGATDPTKQPYITQRPIIKQSFLYSQMAFGFNYNLNRLLRLAKKNWKYRGKRTSHTGGYHRIFLGGLGLALTGYQLVHFNRITQGLPNPAELKDAWKRMLEYLIKGEYNGWYTPFGEIPAGRLPEPTDYMSVAGPAMVWEAGVLIGHIFKGILSSTGLAPKGSSDLARMLQKTKNWDQYGKDFMYKLFANYRGIHKTYLNYKHPYHTEAQNMKDWERKYLATTKNPKADVITNTIMSPYNRDFKELFEQSDRYDKMAESMMAKWWAHFHLYKQDSRVFSDDECAKKATVQCSRILKALNPLSLGVEIDGSLFSSNGAYLTWLMESGIKYENNINYYTDTLVKNVLTYAERLGKYQSAFEYYYNTKYNADDYIKYWKDIKPSNWKELGLIYKNGDLIGINSLNKYIETAKKDLLK